MRIACVVSRSKGHPDTEAHAAKRLVANLYLVISRVPIWSPVLEASYDFCAKNCGSFSHDGYIEPSHLALEAQSGTGETSAFLEQWSNAYQQYTDR